MLVSAFDYDLPEELIAQRPPAERGTSRMLVLDRRTGTFADHLFTALPDLLTPGDLLILNDSRVLPARLFATRAGLHTQANSPEPTGRVEVLLTEHLAGPEGHNDWRALVRPAKKIQLGEVLHFEASSANPQKSLDLPEALSAEPSPAVPNQHDGPPLAAGGPSLRATVVSTGCYGERTLRFDPAPNFHATLERLGHLPLPPYIHRARVEPNTAEDRERYQTVFSTPFALQDSGEPAPSTTAIPGSTVNGSAAAPTAGLHFTPETLARLATRGIETAFLTLHVGLGTFQPVRVADTGDIRLHAEPYTLSAATAEALNRAWREGRRIIAVGTTSTRTLEHLVRSFEAEHGPLDRTANPLALAPHSGSTGLFLSPGLEDRFRLVDGLLTNFHLPQSTLLMLVSAFAGALSPPTDPDAGRQTVLRAYAHALASRYRFFSYGDCMLLL